MRSKSEAIAGIALIMLASIMAGTTAVGATSEGPLSADDCPICPDSRMELYSSFRALALVCDYRNSVDINNCGNIAIWPYDNAGDAQKRFEDMRTYEKELKDYEILRETNDEIVVINRDKVSDSNYHYSVSGVFLDICSEKSYITQVRVNTVTKDKNIAIKRFDALAKCAKSVVDKKCGVKDDVPIIKPDNTSCKDFYVDPKDFDLAYDNKMLRKEFLYFLYDYGSKHELKSASEKYDGWFSGNFGILQAFLFTDEIKKWRFVTGKEDNLGKRIDERFKKEGRPLKPAEVFEESLKINDNCVFDALLTAHNYLKNETHLLRDKRQVCKMLINKTKKEIKELEEILQTEGVMGPDGEIYDRAYISGKAQETLKRRSEKKQEILKQEKLMKDPGSFKRLKELRSETDNEGAWYHLFLTVTMGYGERENEWSIPWAGTITTRNIWLEHRIHKGIFERKGFEIDKVEYCWDVWGGYLAGEIYRVISENQKKVKNKIKEHPEVWVKGEWDPSYILDAYTGQKIYE
jgi:hypothetical protein